MTLSLQGLDSRLLVLQCCEYQCPVHSHLSGLRCHPGLAEAERGQEGLLLVTVGWHIMGTWVCETQGSRLVRVRQVHPCSGPSTAKSGHDQVLWSLLRDREDSGLP
jgi:hypothetical protein